MVMLRQKIIRRIGDSVGVIFNKEEQKILGLQKGAIVEIQVIVVRRPY
jgi:hypothetical protein